MRIFRTVFCAALVIGTAQGVDQDLLSKLNALSPEQLKELAAAAGDIKVGGTNQEEAVAAPVVEAPEAAVVAAQEAAAPLAAAAPAVEAAPAAEPAASPVADAQAAPVAEAVPVAEAAAAPVEPVAQAAEPASEPEAAPVATEAVEVTDTSSVTASLTPTDEELKTDDPLTPVDAAERIEDTDEDLIPDAPSENINPDEDKPLSEAVASSTTETAASAVETSVAVEPVAAEPAVAAETGVASAPEAEPVGAQEAVEATPAPAANVTEPAEVEDSSAIDVAPTEEEDDAVKALMAKTGLSAEEIKAVLAAKTLTAETGETSETSEEPELETTSTEANTETTEEITEETLTETTPVEDSTTENIETPPVEVPDSSDIYGSRADSEEIVTDSEVETAEPVVPNLEPITQVIMNPSSEETVSEEPETAEEPVDTTGEYSTELQELEEATDGTQEENVLDSTVTDSEELDTQTSSPLSDTGYDTTDELATVEAYDDDDDDWEDDYDGDYDGDYDEYDEEDYDDYEEYEDEYGTYKLDEEESSGFGSLLGSDSFFDSADSNEQAVDVDSSILDDVARNYRLQELEDIEDDFNDQVEEEMANWNFAFFLIIFVLVVSGGYYVINLIRTKFFPKNQSYALLPNADEDVKQAVSSDAKEEWNNDDW